MPELQPSPRQQAITTAAKLAQIKALQAERESLVKTKKRLPGWAGILIFAVSIALLSAGGVAMVHFFFPSYDSGPSQEQTAVTTTPKGPQSVTRHGIIKELPDQEDTQADYLLVDQQGETVAYLKEGRKMRDLEGFLDWEVDIRGWEIGAVEGIAILEVEGIIF